MRKPAAGSVVQGVRTLFEDGTSTGLSDGQLLERYLLRGDDSAEAAFRALVDRHGPMVLRACRGVLRDDHAAEDAFQATFLILARKAGAIREHDSVASWLFGVARRVALRADAQRRRRAARERQGVEMTEADLRSSSDRPPESASAVQEEVDRLPERYRAPVVLCYLEGLTQDEAAIRLRLPASTVRVRLMRARSRLRDRLTRRGLAPRTLATLATGRAEVTTPAAPLVDETVRAAIRLAAGRAAGASGPAAALAEGVIRAMFLAQLKAAAVVLAVLSFASFGILASLAGPAPAPKPPGPEPAAAKKAPEAAEKPMARPGDSGPEVAVEAVRRARWVRSTNLAANVVSYGSVNVYPRISGFLRKVPVGIGQRVKFGDVLAIVEDPDLELAVDKAGAQVERGKARVKKAQVAVHVVQAAARTAYAQVQVSTAAVEAADAQVQYRKKQWERLKKLAGAGSIEMRLVEEEEGQYESAASGSRTARSELAVAQAAEVEAAAKVQMAEADVAAVRSDLTLAEAGLREARIRLGYARIVAPFDGVVTRINYHDGALVGPPEGGKAEPIATVVRSDIMLVVVNVPENDVPYLEPGDPATIGIPALGTRGEFHGSILRTGYALDPRNRTLRAEIALPNADGRLRPGLDGVVKVDLETRENVITIPRTAIRGVRRDGAQVMECYRIVDGRAVATPIKVGDLNSSRTEVLEGLKEGDVVISMPTPQLGDGQPVTVRPAGGGSSGR